MKLSSEHNKPGRIVRGFQKSGLLNGSNLFWSFYEPRNFGDWIGPYLFEAFTGKTPIYYPPALGRRSTGVFAAGSILRHIRLPDTAIVWGSGIISDADQFEKPRAVHAVRGPRTQDHLQRLGYPTSGVFGDPGILLPSVYAPKIAKQHRVGIIPHYVDYDRVRLEFAARTDVHVIDVCQDVETVVDDILACEMALSSSLHGIILSHAYGIPCAWIAAGAALDGDGQKFQDYFEAGNVFGAQVQALDGDMSLNSLETQVRDAPMPNLAPLVAPLRACCPFNGSK